MSSQWSSFPIAESGICQTDEFLCVAKQRCISRAWLCDGDDDCGDGSDENNTTVCRGGEALQSSFTIIYYLSHVTCHLPSRLQHLHVSCAAAILPLATNPLAHTSPVCQ